MLLAIKINLATLTNLLNNKAIFPNPKILKKINKYVIFIEISYSYSIDLVLYLQQALRFNIAINRITFLIE